MTLRRGIIAGFAVFIALAAGAALFLRESPWIRACRAVPDADQARYASALELYGQASSAISAGNFSTASDILDLGNSKLGNSYQTHPAPDDTAIIFQAGENEASHSDFKQAARMKQEAMQTRLSMLRRKSYLSGRCRSILKMIGLA